MRIIRSLAVTCFLISISYLANAQSVGIGTISPNSSAQLEIASTTKGLLIPRLGAGQRTVIQTPAKGLMVYDSTTASFWMYNGVIWDELQNVSANTWAKSGNNIYSTNQGYTAIGRNNPFAKLDVFDTIHSPLAVFTGGDKMFLTLAEKNINRGYIGSYAGNPEDVDFGTYGSNISGKVHLTTVDIPRLTVAASGNVGIGTISPASSAALEVSSSTQGVALPRLTTVERQAISNPVSGLIVFDINYKVYFMYDGTGWLPLATIDPTKLILEPQVPADLSINDGMGYSTGIDSQYAIIGAPYQNSLVGAAYIFRKTNGEWSQVAKLVPDVSSSQYFGGSVSIDFPYAVIGAVGYNGLQGAVYVFYYNGTNWIQQNKFLKPGNIEVASFGNSVDIDNNYIVVGAPYANNVASLGGAAYTYKLNAGVWTYHNTLTNASIQANANFGYAVAISDSFIVVGSPGSIIGLGAYTFKLNGSGNWDSKNQLLSVYNSLVYDISSGAPTNTNTVFINWYYRKFGASVDIKSYRNAGTDGESRLFIAVGAPESFFDYGNHSDTAFKVGIVNFFAIEPINMIVYSSMPIFFRSQVPQYNEKNALFGSSVSFSSSKINMTDTPSIRFQLLCGAPGYANNTGQIKKYTIEKNISVVSHLNGGASYYSLSLGDNYSSSSKSFFSSDSANAKTGFSCSIFDENTLVVGLRGLNSNKGGVIFKF
jgi:hypothetical protein